MYDIPHKVALIDKQILRDPHYLVPVDPDSPLFHDPLVRLQDYGLPFLSWHAVQDGSNPPYGRAVQGSRQEGWLRRTLCEKLRRSNELLHRFDAELLILDAYRPLDCQRGLWTFFYERGRAEIPNATEDDCRRYALGYVRDPRQFDPLDARTFPIHATGASIDVVLRQRSTGQWMEMGSGFEEIIPVSKTDYFERQLLEGAIHGDDPRLWNRRLLDWALRSEDFLNDPVLYWHYDWGNQIWVKVKRALQQEAPAAAWYGYIPAPAWTVPDASLAVPESVSA